MSGGATNKWRGVEAGLKGLMQPELHVKILNLVADRINPVSDSLELDKIACGSCVNKTHSPSLNTTKRISIKTNKQKQISRQSNRSTKDLGKTQANTQPTSLSHSQLVTKDLILQKRRILQIESKVIAYTVENTTVSNFSVDLRPALNSQFVSSKMLHHLKLDNLQKQERIKQLQAELERVTQEITEVRHLTSPDGFRKNKAFSEQYMPMSPTLDQPRMHNNYNSMKQGQFSSYCWRFDEASMILPSSSQKSFVLPQSDSKQDHEFLLRMIKTQALQLQKTKSLANRQRIFTRFS